MASTDTMTASNLPFISQTADTQTILFRADATRALGTGHLMRCLALAELCMEQGKKVVFAVGECPAALSPRLTASKIEVVVLEDGRDAEELLSRIQRYQPVGIVIDGYQFDEHYRQSLAASGLPVLAMDDGTSTHPLHADIVVNSSPLASAADYATIAAGARLLLGPDYAPLRSEFRHCKPVAQASSADVPHVLVTFGGSDPLGLTLPVVTALLDTLPQQLLLDVVVGGATADDDKIDRLAREHTGRIHLHKNTSRMAELMQHATMTIAAAGSTLWELAYLAIPTIAVVVADNQAVMLKPPLGDWFDSIDARSSRENAVAQIARASQALWQDSETRSQRRTALSRLRVGEKAAAICTSFDKISKRPL